jgi:hypothetical protein
MNTDIDDDRMIDEIRSGFEGAMYRRTAPARRSRAPLAVGAMGVTAAVAATAVVVAGTGARSPALAWSPTPQAATAADEDAARTACASGDVTSVIGSAFAVSSGPDDRRDPATQSVFVQAEGAPGDRPPDGGTIVVHQAGGASAPTVMIGEPTADTALPLDLPASPSELPPLVSLDLRGTGGLAVFADDDWTVRCTLLRGDHVEAGPIMVSPTDHSAPTDTLAVTSGSATTWDDGRTIATIEGIAPVGATTVELTLPGLEPATAAVTEGRFSMWWFGPLDPTAGTLRALGPDGSELAHRSPMLDVPSAPPASPAGTPDGR